MRILLIDDDDLQLRALSNYFRVTMRAVVATEITGTGGKVVGDKDPGWDVVAIDRQLLWEHGGGTACGDGLPLAAIFRRDKAYEEASIVLYSRGWVHESFEAISKEYAPCGIFPCDGANGPEIAKVIDRTVGTGPWAWKAA